MLELRNISLSIDGLSILNGINLTLKQGRIYCILGPSGGGKTSLLRVIAGLERRYTGSIQHNGRSIDHLDAQARGFGMMFQDFALFPHFNALENVGFALRMRGLPRHIWETQARALLAQVGLQSMAQRGIHQLSGGEKQRVALARSLAHEPPLIMLDEPLGSLDASLRYQLAMELRQHLRAAQTTSLYVTHDQSEAFMLADYVVVLAEGRQVQTDTPQQLYFQPRTRFVCEFLGLDNVIPSELLGSRGAWICLHPTGLYLSKEGRFEGVVQDVLFEGYHTALTITWQGHQLRWRVPSRIDIPPVGEVVRFDVHEEAIVRLEA